MKNYYTKLLAKSRGYLTGLLAIMLLVSTAQQAQAQCTTCTNGITSTNSNITVGAGQVMCLTYSGTYTKNITVNGGTLCISSATQWNGAAISVSGSGTINNYGTSNRGFTVPNGFTYNNYGNYSGALTVSAGGTAVNQAGGTISSTLTLNGSFTNNGTLSGSTTLNSGGSFTNNNTSSTALTQAGGTGSNYGSFTGALTQNGGSFTNYSGGTMSNTISIKGTFDNQGTLSNGVTVTTGGLLNNYNSITGSLVVNAATAVVKNYGSITSAFNQSAGLVEDTTGGTFAPSGTPTFTAGTFVNDLGGTATMTTMTIKSGYTFTNNGDMTATSVGNQAGGIINFTGTSQTVNGSVNNQSTINFSGTLTITGTYTDGTFLVPSTIKAVGSGNNCNLLQIGAITNSTSVGTFDGNSVGLTLTGATPSTAGRMINGASGPVTAPGIQGSALALPVSGLNVSGSFNAAAGANGYLVLRYIGGSSPSDNPVNNTKYAVGDVIGSSTVEAIVTGTAGAKSFSDVLPISSCGQNVYYTVFSFNGTQPCEIFNLSSPLSSSITMVVPTVTITPGGATTFCTPSSVVLTASGSAGTYLWSTSASTAAITASSSANYTVTVTNSQGCTASDAELVTANTTPSPVITPSGPTTICTPASVTLTASGGGTYLWSTGAATAAISVNTTGTYTVTVTSAVGGCTASASQSVTVNTTPTASVTPSGATTFCAGGSVDLTAAGGTYLWSTGATTATITATTSATYTVTVTNPVGGCTASANRVVTVNALPVPVITPSGATTICTPATVTLTASGGGTYAWSTGVSTAAIVASTSGTYTVTVTNPATCTASVSRSVTVNTTPTPSITPSGPTTFCAGGSVTLTAGGGGTYLWSTGASTAAIAATTSGTYTVTVTGAVGGCTASANRVVTVNANPVASSTSAVSCFGAAKTITASGGGTYLWSTGAATASITQSPASTTSYTVTVTNVAGCTAAATGTITVDNPAPTTTNPAVCAGNRAVITATGGGTYLWSTGSTTDTTSSLTAGVFSVTVTDVLGCSASTSGIITVNALPTPSATSANLCPGGTATITASGGSIYTWSSGETTASITKSAPGTYTVTATNIGSCTATASGTITAVANPTASATNGVTCSGVPAVITASGGTRYVWSTTDTTASISVTTIGTYTVTVSNASGCTATASSSVTAAALPTAGITNPTPSRCVGQSATLTGTGGVSYTWSTGAGTAAISVSPVSTATYTVTVRNAGGCSATASTTVTVNALPIASATGGVICTGTPTSPAVLTASGGTSYTWSNGTLTANNSVTGPATYTVTVTNAATCSATASAVATSAAKPTATATNATTCNGNSVTLTAGGGTSYAWNTGASTPSITVSPSVTTYYSVIVSNAAGCFVVKADTATINPLPTAAPNSNTPVMLSTPINLTSNPAAGTPGYTYSWTGPSAMTSTSVNPTIASAAVSNGGIYYLTVTDSKGCTATGNTAVVLNYAAPGGLGSNTALWLYGDSVIATGTTVTGWYDASQLNNDVTGITGTAPTLVAAGLNAHPAVNFAGTGGLRGTFLSSVTSNAVSAFVVTKANSASNFSSGIFSIGAATADSAAATNANLFARGNGSIYSQRNSTTEGSYTNANAIGQYHMATSIYNAVTNRDSFFVEGLAQTTGTYAAANFGATRYSVGERMGATTSYGNYLNGQVAEVALFNKQVTATEKQQIESYLAIKYGFTLDQTVPTNYIEANGTIYWNAAANTVYKNNIFGVGKEPVTALNQIQSVSINTNILSINSASGLTSFSYLVVADDNGANSVSAATGLPNSINAKLARKWRVSQTGTRTAANFVFDRASTSFGYYANIGASMVPFLLIDSDANGVYESYKALSSTSGTTSTFNANLSNGCIFTIGFKANIDYGDAFYVATTNASSGAAHLIVPGVSLGTLIDGELDGVPSVNAMGDDTIGLADDDGVTFNPGVPTSVNIVTMGSNSITVVASVAGYLNAWADFDQSGSYDGGSEYAIQNRALVAGTNTVTFNVSDSVQYGPTSMRFRFATGIADVTAATGLATNGEVEDYEIYVTAPLVAACTNGFQNPGFEMGPGPGTYIITGDNNLPYWRTNATDRQIEVWQSGFNGVSSHGGTYFVELEANLYGSLYQDVYTTPGTILKWSFSHRGRSGSDTAEMRIGTPQATVLQKTVIDGTSGWGNHTGFYTVPAGQYITRLEFVAVGSYGGNNSIGNFLDDVSVGSSFDYGDAPNSYGTLIASGGPYHSSTGNLYLGTGVTCDADGQPSATANADALDDGITFPAVCANCNTYTVSISAFNNTGAIATVAGWIDFNKNGIFEASERRSVNIPSSVSQQTVSMTFTVSVFSASQTYTFARFRIANDSTELATAGGMAKSGEVEDYKVPCTGIPTPVPTATPSTICARGPMTLTATGSAPSYSWTGPNGYTSSLQSPNVAAVNYADSGYYRVYAVYANGCETDSAVKVTVNNCMVSLAGNFLDDANGNGVKDGVEVTSNNSQTLYAVLSSSSNVVLDKSVAIANGGFTFASVPAYTTGMKITPSTTNPSIGAATPAIAWPTNWVGTKSQYGTNNNAGTGTYTTADQVPVSVDIKNLSSILFGYDRLPSSTPKSYTIARPRLATSKAITPANGLGMFGGTDPEDGTFTAGSTFTITSLAGLNGNRLFYDANGDGTQQAYEEITGYTVITNVDPTKFIVRFNGIASTTMTFNYATTDAAGKVDPAPTTYTINWGSTLPVQLTSFTGEKYNETSTKLNWSTASEINNDHFDVERSTDGSNWVKIGEVKGNGNTNEKMSYSMVDDNPATGANYYRLKQVDFDGKFEYTDIVEVDFGTDHAEVTATTVMNIYPNPLSAGKGLNINLKGSEDNIKQIAITNEMGQVVYNTDAQDNHYEIQGLDLPAGIYMVHIVSQANAAFTGKIIVTK